MFKYLRALRTNENILVAADVLLSSKSSFMNVFLMGFMINISASSSPVSFVVYCIIRYTLMACFAVLFLPFYRKHTVAAWRMSMLFSILEIVSVVFLDAKAVYFPCIIAIFNAADSSFYWRPKMHFDVTEVPDSRRLAFKGRTSILTEIVKIVMPLVLGFLIGNSSYTRVALIILGISLMQLLLSLCFRPTKKHTGPVSGHKASQMYDIIMKHESMRKLFAIQLVRGFVICSSAYLVISQICLYRSTDSSMDVGIFTSLSSVIAIITVFIYRKIRQTSHQKAFLAAFIPAIILLPASMILIPNNPVLSIALYVFMQSIVNGLFDGTVTQTRLQGLLSTHLKDDSYRIELECLSEIALSVGRVVGLTILLFILIFGDGQQILWLALVESLFIIPWLAMILPKKHHYN